MHAPDNPVHRYHDGTKHHFHHFARSLGYLDWATQPRPFRSFDGTHFYSLFPAPDAHAGGYASVAVGYQQLFDPAALAPTPVSAGAIGDFLRHSLGLSAWKAFGSARWSLRVNPSSGNLHPTEAYLVCGPVRGLSPDAGVYHYAPDRHGLEQRCAFDTRAWTSVEGRADTLLVALTSIHWREAWKYGERAFRYCQHDLGHAVAALTLAARVLGWTIELLPAWSHAQIGALVGVDRDADYVDAEREEPGCLLVVTSGASAPSFAGEPRNLIESVRAGRWHGRASQLSEDHIQWTFIDEVADATRDPGRLIPARPAAEPFDANATGSRPVPPLPDARTIILQRRSAVAFDHRSAIDAATFFQMLARTLNTAAPLDALWWTPKIHFVLFVHRVTGVDAGLYLFGRHAAGFERLLQHVARRHPWETAHESLPLMRLGRGDSRSLARRLSCDQDIASDGCFSLGMLADFDASLAEYGPSFYRHLFWESGAIGQVLYLEAEAAGVRATGIGCFYDDPVHEMLGLQNHEFQSLYHFTVGHPVEDTRLTTDPGYAWEVPAR